MSDLISVIVPVYNVEKYLHKCFDSILSQTYSDIEIIAVDDGSTDQSGLICDQYALQDPRVNVIHKKNGGLSEARNVGIDNAHGRYIGFVDSDDYIDNKMYETLYDLISTFSADMAMCGLFDVYKDRISKKNANKVFCVDKEKAIKIVLEAKITSVTAVNKLYKRELFSEIRYPINRTAEDAFIIIDLLCLCKKVVITTEQFYFYNHRPNSITTKSFNLTNLDTIVAYQKNYELIVDHFPKLKETALMRLCWAHFYVLDRLILDNDYRTLKKNIITFLKKNFSFIMKDKRFLKTRKIAELFLMINPCFYKMFVLLHNKIYRVTE